MWMQLERIALVRRISQKELLHPEAYSGHFAQNLFWKHNLKNLT